MARLFTVIIEEYDSTDLTRQGQSHRAYECDFAGLHFSRAREADLKHWVRIAAKRVYGPDTQVIFLHSQKG